MLRCRTQSVNDLPQEVDGYGFLSFNSQVSNSRKGDTLNLSANDVKLSAYNAHKSEVQTESSESFYDACNGEL